MKGNYKRCSSETTSERLSKLKYLQSLNFTDKLNISIKVINKSMELGKNALLYSGGKDSSVLLSILDRYFDKNKFIVMYNNTTLGRNDFISGIRESTLNFNYIETTAENPVKMWQQTGYFPILGKRYFSKYKIKYPDFQSSPVQCCYQLKEKKSNPILKKHKIKSVIWGNRAGESNRRKLSFVDNGFLFKPVKYPWYQAYPLQHWLSKDIFRYLYENVPKYKFYKEFESGCICCGTDLKRNPNNLMYLFNSNRVKWEYFMEIGFAKNILIAKGLGNKLEDINNIIKNKPEILLQII